MTTEELIERGPDLSNRRYFNSDRLVWLQTQADKAASLVGRILIENQEQNWGANDFQDEADKYRAFDNAVQAELKKKLLHGP